MFPGKSWIFFLKISGHGKSWKITLVLESRGNYNLMSWKVVEKIFFKVTIFLQAQMEIIFFLLALPAHRLLVVPCFKICGGSTLYSNTRGLRKVPGKFFHGGPGKVFDFCQ